MLNRLVLFILFIPFFCHSQEYDRKALGVGLSTYGASGPYALELPYSVSVFNKINRHEISFGADVYTTYWRYILGANAGYKYYFFKKDKPFNVFADISLHYVRYGMGLALPTKYNYPAESGGGGTNVMQVSCLLNLFGVGSQYTFCNRFSLFLVCSGGYNYYESHYTPGSTYADRNIYGATPGNGTIPVFYVKTGLSVKLLRDKQEK